MAQDDKQKKNNGTQDSNDVISDLEVLSKKYGLSFDASAYTGSSASDRYKPTETPASSSARPYTPPKNNTPAVIPQVVYDHKSTTPQLRVIYGNEPTGPEGRRVVYSEQEGESIADKRKRVREAQKSKKGGQGFGSQPQVKHVASSSTALARDDEDKFARAYQDSKRTGATGSRTKSDSTVTSPKTSSRLVASQSEDKKTKKHQHYEPTAGEKVTSFFKAFLPWKGDSAKEVFRKIIMDISAIAVIICFGYFVDNYIQHKNKLDLDSSLGELQTDAQIDNEDALWAKIKAEFPDVVFPEGMNIKYAKHYAVNQDMIGWLKIDNTNIDTPITYCPDDRNKSPDEDNFYLYHNFYKTDDKYGHPFLDPYNSGKTLDKNNVIYGHNMKDGLSFAQLEKYYTLEGFKESPIIKYSTLFEDYYFKVYAVFVTNGYHSGDNGYLFDYTVPNFTGEKNFSAFIEAIDERKLYDTGVDINPNDKLITLSTCSYEIKQNQMGRLAVVGRLVRKGESTAVDTSKVTVNENIRYPQIWYDEHGISNPFKNATQWIPE